MNMKVLMYFVISVFTGTTLAGACKVDGISGVDTYRYSVVSGTIVGNQEGNFNDYGRIHHDANNSSCAQRAAEVLEGKLRHTLAINPGEFGEWLRGAHVALIFAAALRIGEHGYATQELDKQLRGNGIDPGVANVYAFNREPGCGKEQGNNTCMDDHAVAASGFAWIAAYKYRRGESLTNAVSPIRIKAGEQIQKFFDETCIRKTTSAPSSTLCNGTVDEIVAGTAETLTFNHGQQKPAYGFGLMTSIASAVMGLQVAGSSLSFGYDNDVLADALMREMQKHVDVGPYPDAYDSTCFNMTRNPNVVLDPSKACGGTDANQYYPQMYALHEFYRQKLSGIPNLGVASKYQSTSIYSGHFNLTSGATSFFSFPRYATYVTHAYSWWQDKPAFMPFDNNEPKGWLEQIGSTGMAQGWACDRDMAKKPVVVDLYADGQLISTQRADSEAEDPIRIECNGVQIDPNNHRFWVQLPSWTKGKTITAVARDYTWYGSTTLGCLQSGGCRW